MRKFHWDNPVLDLFEEISQIPRGSGNERAISDWLMSWAKAHGLEAVRDGALNVLIRKSGAPGCEDAEPVMLQGHMDMVCEKVSGSHHDFTRDPIRFVVDGEYLRADGTTLGADNGIGMAMALAVLADSTLSHPPLECLITTGEEVGMLGAKALDATLFQCRSKTLINLDTGIGEGIFVAGCAGGGRVAVKLPVSRESVPPTPAWTITVSGLKGGHSGAEIHLGRANANQLLGRILYGLGDTARLCALSGGTKENVIPRQAQATVVCSDGKALAAHCAHCQKVLLGEFGDTDNGLTVICAPSGEVTQVYSADTHKALLSLLGLLPCGVIAMDRVLNCVATSANLGAITSDDACVIFQSSIRSSLPSHLTGLLLPQYDSLSALCGATCETHDFYPGWTFRPQSKVRQAAMASYKTLGSVEPRCMTLHGGLECGVLMDVLGDMDAISFAPELNSPHSPSENLRIPSVALNYQVLTEILTRLK